MAMMDKTKLAAGLAKLNDDLAKSGKTLQEAEHDEKSEALGRMKTVTNDPKYREKWQK